MSKLLCLFRKNSASVLYPLKMRIFIPSCRYLKLSISVCSANQEGFSEYLNNLGDRNEKNLILFPLILKSLKDSRSKLILELNYIFVKRILKQKINKK